MYDYLNTLKNSGIDLVAFMVRSDFRNAMDFYKKYGG